ncbi:MAG TPA: acyl-CoA desaturase [Archangium sp.]|nr:acyl-CoA desaturase [Archangium sp.]
MAGGNTVRPGDGRVRWNAGKSLWFGLVSLVAVVGAVPTFTPGAFVLFAVSTALTLCAGHSVGIHRGLIHRAYRVPRWLEYTLTYLGVLVGLDGPRALVRMHNTRDFQQNEPWCHDYFAHRQPAWRDYFWNLHCRFEFAQPFEPRLDARVEADAFHGFLQRTWMWQQLPWAVLFLAVGGLPWLVWGIFVRVAVSTTGHWFVGYVAHRQGYRGWHNEGAAVQGFNSLLLGALSMGEGWHNNHHTFPRSARLGIRWWEVDLGWGFLTLLRSLGLATDILEPGEKSRAHHARPLPSEDPCMSPLRVDQASRSERSRLRGRTVEAL